MPYFGMIAQQILRSAINGKAGIIFFGTDELYEKLSDLGDPLEVLSKRIPWDKFANRIKLCRMRKARKSNAGRKPYSDDLMFMPTLPIAQDRYQKSLSPMAIGTRFTTGPIEISH